MRKFHRVYQGVYSGLAHNRHKGVGHGIQEGWGAVQGVSLENSALTDSTSIKDHEVARREKEHILS